MASFDIGALLRRERIGRGLTIDDIARDTRIAPRFLEAIETDDFSGLPGLLFTRNFVRQYALTLKLDPDPLLAELPKPDESTFQLPIPPARVRSSYYKDRSIQSILSSAGLLIFAGIAGIALYSQFHSAPPAAIARPAATSPAVRPDVQTSAPVQKSPAAQTAAAVQIKPSGNTSPVRPSPAPPVQVSLTAHEPAWIEVSADGKTAFTGTLQPNETKEVSAAEQVKILTGNAGALTIALNGKTLDQIGPLGDVRAITLTAEGPRLLKAPPLPDDAL